MLRASVTIATWNRRELLEQVIEALEHQTMPAADYEVIVCDSGSTDGTEEAVRTLALRFCNLRYVSVVANNLAVKRNEGIRAARANVVVFMDDDVIPDFRFVESHIRAHAGSTGVVYCGQIRYPGKWIARSNYFRYRDSRHLGAGRSDVCPDPLPPWMITVMNLSFKRDELVMRVGYVSEEFTRYGGEDTQLGFRIVTSGMRLVYLPDALVFHYEYNGSIQQYHRKLYITSRDSAPILYRLCPEALLSTKTRHLERIYLHRTGFAIALRAVASMCVHPLTVRLYIRILELIDGLRFFYLPFIYRFLTVIATMAGIRDRLRSSTHPGSGGAWFE